MFPLLYSPHTIHCAIRKLGQICHLLLPIVLRLYLSLELPLRVIQPIMRLLFRGIFSVKDKIWCNWSALVLHL